MHPNRLTTRCSSGNVFMLIAFGALTMALACNGGEKPRLKAGAQLGAGGETPITQEPPVTNPGTTPQNPTTPTNPTNPTDAIAPNTSYYVGARQVKTNAQGTELEPDGVKAVLGDNCNGDHYQLSGESMKCSRGPLCKTPDTKGPDGEYDRLNTEEFKPNPQACMGDGNDGRGGKGCAGLVPYCCYVMAATGDFTKCVGYWERLWCTKSQCDEALSKGASDDQCGGCQCGHAFKSYCGENAMQVPLVKRLKDAGLLKTSPQQ